jgi:glutamate--cysteine ligase
MYHLLHQRLQSLQRIEISNVLRKNLVGIERESLRVTPDGNIANTTHPQKLGAALTHPFITTDYSEALLEIITPPQPNGHAVIQTLTELHQFVHSNLSNEYLWAASMPGILAGEASIPIATYGVSNAGQMKTVYRRGLGLRYGRNMQAIAGIHFNFSLSQEYWHIAQELTGNHQSIQEYSSAAYMSMIRNIQRYGWLVPYLFGASPVVSTSFVANRHTDLLPFTPNTLYYPHATSLRMGNIGYQNSLEACKGFHANYDNLNSYIQSLTWAITTPCQDYEAFNLINDAGEYQQLNANLLQIENEHYSSIRPKQILTWLEKPVFALRKRGIHYVELRSLDVNIFEPIGVTTEQLYFLEILLLFCLWHESPRISAIESKEINANQILVAHQGRKPNLQLTRNQTPITMQHWAQELLTEMLPIAALLDNTAATLNYAVSINIARQRVTNPDTTPSAIMLDMMFQHQYSFLEFGLQLSKAHRTYISTIPPLSIQQNTYYQQLAITSHQQQQELERNDRESFAQFLATYFNQQ